MDSKKLDKVSLIKYNEHGKGFEELLAEGVRQANLHAIQKQIIEKATLEKESCYNE